MEPLIYSFSNSSKPVNLDEKKIRFDNFPSPELIKYGFNDTIYNLDMNAIYENEYYKVGLEFDFDRKDSESIAKQGEKKFGKSIINKNFCAIWEIFNLFGLLKEIKIEDISTSKQADIMFKNISSINLDENAYIQLILDELPKIVSSQKIGSNMILQIFNCMTNPFIELIYYLTSFYTESYIIKPITSSMLSDEKYLVLLGSISDIKLDKIKKNKNKYLATLGLSIPNNISSIIQCMNADLMYKKSILYWKIKKYLDNHIYEGPTYQDFINDQNKNSTIWLDIFDSTVSDKFTVLLDNILQESTKKCNHQMEFNSIFS